MYSDLESNESKRREVVSSLYWSLMQGWNIPLSIQEYYGLTEDYRLFHQLEGMAPDEYLRKRQTGEVPDILEVDARLTHAVEKIFESVCGLPGTGCPICQDDRQTSLCGRVLQEYQACPHGLLGNNTAEETAHHRPS